MRVYIALLKDGTVELSEIEVIEGTTVQEALRKVGLTVSNTQSLAIWNERCQPDRVLVDGDRIEILPPLTVDPMTARRLREAKNQVSTNRLAMGRNGGKQRLF